MLQQIWGGQGQSGRAIKLFAAYVNNFQTLKQLWENLWFGDFS